MSTNTISKAVEAINFDDDDLDLVLSDVDGETDINDAQSMQKIARGLLGDREYDSDPEVKSQELVSDSDDDSQAEEDDEIVTDEQLKKELAEEKEIIDAEEKEIEKRAELIDSLPEEDYADKCYDWITDNFPVIDKILGYAVEELKKAFPKSPLTTGKETVTLDYEILLVDFGEIMHSLVTGEYAQRTEDDDDDDEYTGNIEC